ncbi:MAG TPA: MFS transporter [Rubrobacter sp.]|nr:MFS transporter [Rubrobacter sp.]
MGLLTRLRELPWLKLLEARHFRWMWIGAGLSMLADQAFLVALTWLVLRVSGAGVELGTVLAVASLPGIVLMPVGGVISDRFSPTPVLFVASAVRTLLLSGLAALVLLDATQLWHVYALAGGLSAMDALYYPASMSVIPTVVDKAGLGAANALIQGAEQVSGIAGPAIAASTVALLGLGSSFVVNAFMFFAAAAVFASMIRVTGSRTVMPNGSMSESEAVADPEEFEGETGTGALAELLAGVRYAWQDPIIRTILLVLVGINAAMVGPLYVGGATLAESQLGGVGAFGTLVAVASAGAVLGSLAAGSIERVRRRGLAVLGLTATLGLEVAAFAFVSNLPAATVLALAIGASASCLAVINVSWLQERSEAALTGRVMSLALFATVALDPISFALAGVLVEVNLRAMFLGAGVLLLLTAILGAASRNMRESD